MTTDTPPNLVGSRAACDRLEIVRSTLTRWVDSGLITPVGKLDGKNGAYIFTEDEVARLERERAT